MKVAIIWEEDEPEHSKHITYKQLLKETCRLANALKRFGVKKGDVVAIYMPMVPETIYAMMACVRIGAIHRYNQYVIIILCGICPLILFNFNLFLFVCSIISDLFFPL